MVEDFTPGFDFFKLVFIFTADDRAGVDCGFRVSGIYE